MGLFDWFTRSDSPQFQDAFRKANPWLRRPDDMGPAPAPPPGGLLGITASPARAGTNVDLTPQPGQGQSLSTYNPSWSEDIQSGVQSGLETAGVSRALARDYGDKAQTAAQFTPGVGQVLSANDFYRASRAGDTTGMALGAIGMLPGKGGAALKYADEGVGALARGEGKGVLNLVRKEAPAAEREAKGLIGTLKGTVGDINNPDVLFEGKSPHDFTPDQWYRFGKAHGVDNLGPQDAAEWEKSLKHYKTVNGQDFTIPGGVDSKDPFTYYDLLHLKSQGINPNDMPPEMHQAIHDRMVKTMSPSGEVSPERLFNQFALAQISPNQPLTPNELAVARSMAKSPEDLKKWGEMIPWRHDDAVTPKQIMQNPDGSDMMRTVKYKDKVTGEDKTKEVPMTMRKYYGDKIANDLGLGAGDKGGLGARGTADYTRIAETAQRIQDKPDFFRFRGEGEGGGTNAGDWANFVERLTSQTPGLSAKTGSFGAVWQNPAMANISAVDRHMAGLFTEEMFPSKEAFQSFAKEHVDKFNAMAPEGKQVKSFTQLPDGYKNDAMFGYLNQHPSMNLMNKKGVNPNVPAHLTPENADWVSDPKKVQLISDAYKRVLGANAERANQVGQSTFANQWMLWDRIRNRLEPHEIMFPGLEKLPRMSMDQMHTARQALTDAGYMSSAKGLIDEETGVAQKGLAPVRKMSNASKAAYFGVPLTMGGASLMALMNRGAGPQPTNVDDGGA